MALTESTSVSRGIKPLGNLFTYIRREKKRDQYIIISSDEESNGESDSEPLIVSTETTGGLDDPIDVDSDTELSARNGLLQRQRNLAFSEIIDVVPVTTPESVLTEPTPEFVSGDASDEQDDAISIGSPPLPNPFGESEMDCEQFALMGVNSPLTMQVKSEPNSIMNTQESVIGVQLDVNMGESSHDSSLVLDSYSVSTKIEQTLLTVDGIGASGPSASMTILSPSYKRALEPSESSSTSSDVFSDNNDNGVLNTEEDNEMDIEFENLILAAPTTAQTRNFEDMSLSEVLGSIEIYLQAVTDISDASKENTNKPKTRQTRKSSRYQRNNTPPQYYPSLGESSQAAQAAQYVPGSSCDFHLPRPYIPARVWYNCTWEDWTQFNPGNIIHIPFSEEETEIVIHQMDKHHNKKVKISRTSLDFWQVVEDLLPGRSAQDCRYFWFDYKRQEHVFTNPIMIKKPKKPLKSINEYMMLRQRRSTGNMRRSDMTTLVWTHLSRENTISGGSGDALTLAIFKNPRTKNINIAAGCLCDENLQYNIPGNLRIWDSNTDEVTTLEGHNTVMGEHTIWRTVTDVKMSKDGSLILSASRDGSAKFWKSRNGKLISTLCYHDKPINQLAVNKQVPGNIVATCSNDGSATIWSLNKNGKEGTGMACDLDTEEYQDPVVECIQFGRMSTHNQLIMGISNSDISHPGYVTAFDGQKGVPIIRYGSIGGSVCAIDISPTGRYIASGNYNNSDVLAGDGFVHIHDYRHVKTQIKVSTKHADVNMVSFSPCERYIASGNADKENGEVIIFDIRTPSKPLHTLSHSLVGGDQSMVSPDSSVGIGGLHWMSNSKTFVTGGGDSKVKIWNLAGATELLKSYETTNCVTSLAVDEDCMTLAAGVAGAQGIVHVWQP